MEGQNHISPFGSGKSKLSEEKLMAYFEGKLSPEEQHEVEQWLADESMEADALEGMGLLRPADVRPAVDRLQHKLRKQLLGKKRARKTLKTDQVTWLAIGIILFLIVVGYLVIRLRVAH
jgi:anti-sigma factor RsiW